MGTVLMQGTSHVRADSSTGAVAVLRLRRSTSRRRETRRVFFVASVTLCTGAPSPSPIFTFRHLRCTPTSSHVKSLPLPAPSSCTLRLRFFFYPFSIATGVAHSAPRSFCCPLLLMPSACCLEEWWRAASSVGCVFLWLFFSLFSVSLCQPAFGCLLHFCCLLHRRRSSLSLCWLFAPAPFPPVVSSRASILNPVLVCRFLPARL